MSDGDHREGPATGVDISWVESRGIEVRAWPSAGSGPTSSPTHPVLYLVDVGAEPPSCRELEDWIRRPLDRGELQARADRLIERSRRVAAHLTRVDENDVLRVGDQLVILSPLEARMLRLLTDRLGEVVPREEIIDCTWPDGPPSDPRALDNRLKVVRARIAGLPLEIHTLRGRGLLLERVATTDG